MWILVKCSGMDVLVNGSSNLSRFTICNKMGISTTTHLPSTKLMRYMLRDYTNTKARNVRRKDVTERRYTRLNYGKHGWRYNPVSHRQMSLENSGAYFFSNYWRLLLSTGVEIGHTDGQSKNCFIYTKFELVLSKELLAHVISAWEAHLFWASLLRSISPETDPNEEWANRSYAETWCR